MNFKKLLPFEIVEVEETLPTVEEKLKSLDDAVERNIIEGMEKISDDIATASNDEEYVEAIHKAITARRSFEAYKEAKVDKTEVEAVKQKVNRWWKLELSEGAWMFLAKLVGGGLSLFTAIYITLYTDKGNFVNDSLRKIIDKNISERY